MHRQELQHLRLIASTSSLLLVFAHEVKSLLGMLSDSKGTLEELAKSTSESISNQLTDRQNEFSFTKDRFGDLLEMTSLVAAEDRSGELEKLAVAPRAEKALSCFDLMIKKYEIDVSTSDVPRALKVGPMLQAELYAIFLNVYSNAIKSVIAAGDTKRISVTASRENDRAHIKVLDTGIGTPEDPDLAFDPFRADADETLYSGLEERLNPEDSYIVGTGSGLGLSIVRQIVHGRGGVVRFEEPPEEWKCCLGIKLP